jgi:hypothetical protein
MGARLRSFLGSKPTIRGNSPNRTYWSLPDASVKETLASKKRWRRRNAGVKETLALKERWRQRNAGVERTLALKRRWRRGNVGVERTLASKKRWQRRWSLLVAGVSWSLASLGRWRLLVVLCNSNSRLWITMYVLENSIIVSRERDQSILLASLTCNVIFQRSKQRDPRACLMYGGVHR